VPKQSPYTLEGFVRYAGRLRTEDGKPLRIRPFQREFVRPHFAGVPEVVIVVPKGNGKTTLLAALALYHLETVPGADVFIAATSVRQARILFRQAAAMVKRSGLDNLEVKSGYGEIRMRGDMARVGPRIQVVSSEAGGEDGAQPTLALIDELHRHRDGDLYGVFRDGLPKRRGRMLTISTAGATMDSPLGRLRALALKHRSFKRSGMVQTARWPGFAWHEICLAPEDDPNDLSLVRRANPLLRLADLRTRRDSPSTTPWQWLRFACGIWTEGEEPWLDPQVWDRLATRWAPRSRESVFVGVDVGIRDESPAIVLVARRDGGLLAEARILEPEAELEEVEDDLRRLALEFSVRWISYDPRSFERSAQLLAKEGFRMAEFPMTVERMSKASTTLWRLLERGELAHDGSAEFRTHVLSGVVKEDGRGWRVARDPKTRRPVAALMALLMAVQAAEDSPSQELMTAWA
jgi:phage terminase large subunit-like protein